MVGRAASVGEREAIPPAQADDVQWDRIGVHPERTQPVGNPGRHLPIGIVEFRCGWIAERMGHPSRMIGGRVHQQATVDHPPDSRRCSAKAGRPVRLRCQPPNRYVQASGLAKPGGNADLTSPPLLLGNQIGQTGLPRKRVAPVVDGTIERRERGHGRQALSAWPIRAFVGDTVLLSHRAARTGQAPAGGRHR